MGRNPRAEQSAAESFVWRTLCPPIDVLADFGAIGRDSMDPEALHQFRVALRRLRSDLRSLRPLLDKRKVTELRDRLSELDELVRPVRDGDVMIERLSASAAQAHNPIDPEIVEAIHQYLTTSTDLAREKLLMVLESGTYYPLFAELAGLASGDILRGGAVDDFPQELERLNKELWRRVRRAARSLPDDADDADLHQLRVLAKRSRYLSEASMPELGKSAKRRARDAARIQWVLGEHQDSVVFSRKLLEMPRPTPAHTLAIDALLAVETDARQRLRKRWRKVWRRVDRRG